MAGPNSELSPDFVGRDSYGAPIVGGDVLAALEDLAGALQKVEATEIAPEAVAAAQEKFLAASADLEKEKGKWLESRGEAREARDQRVLDLLVALDLDSGETNPTYRAVLLAPKIGAEVLLSVSNFVEQEHLASQLRDIDESLRSNEGNVPVVAARYMHLPAQEFGYVQLNHGILRPNAGFSQEYIERPTGRHAAGTIDTVPQPSLVVPIIKKTHKAVKGSIYNCDTQTLDPRDSIPVLHLPRTSQNGGRPKEPIVFYDSEDGDIREVDAVTHNDNGEKTVLAIGEVSVRHLLYGLPELAFDNHRRQFVKGLSRQVKRDVTHALELRGAAPAKSSGRSRRHSHTAFA